MNINLIYKNFFFTKYINYYFTEKFKIGNYYFNFYLNNIYIYYLNKNGLFFFSIFYNIINININTLILFFKFIFSGKILLGQTNYDLKGVNYRFNIFLNKIFLDLGNSHFQVFKFNKLKYIIKLKKKKQKKLLFITFNKFTNKSIINFFGFNLGSVGPYKLKGFQFVNEGVNLKEGKKPFK